MARPKIEPIRRLANKLWLAKLVLDWREQAESQGERFTLSDVASKLLSVGVREGEGEEGLFKRERLQALATIRRTGSDPSRCERSIDRELVPQEISPWAFEVTGKRRAKSRQQAEATSQPDRRMFLIDAVARADQWVSGSSEWYRPMLISVLTPPGLSRDRTRELLALELARIGFVRPETMGLERTRELLRGGVIDTGASELKAWERSLAAILKINTIHSLGVLALMLQEARISFVSEDVCFSIYLTLRSAVDNLLASPELKEFVSPLLGFIETYLWSQRWQDQPEDEAPLPISMPMSLERWMRHCEKRSPDDLVLPDVPAISDAGMETIDLLRRRVTELYRKVHSDDSELSDSLQMTGVTTLLKEVESIWSQIKDGEIEQPISRIRRPRQQ